MNKIIIGLLPVLTLYVVQKLWIPFETLQLWTAAVTLPFAVVFILAYLPERPWREWFATSLLLLAVGVLFYVTSVILFRLYGPDYWGRDLMVVGSVGLVCTAMVMRTFVLLSLQRGARYGLGSVGVQPRMPGVFSRSLSALRRARR